MTANDGNGVSRDQELKTGAKQLAASILNANPDSQVGVVDFDSDTVLNLVFSDDNDDGGTSDTLDSQEQVEVDAAIDAIDASGGTNIATGIDTGDAQLAECEDPNARTIQIVVTDAGANLTAASDSADAAVGSGGNTGEIFAIGTGGATETSLQAFARPVDDAHVETYFRPHRGDRQSGPSDLWRGSLLPGLAA